MLLQSHFAYSTLWELVYSSCNIGKLVSNVDVIDVKIHVTTTDSMGFHFQEFPDQSHAAVLVYRTQCFGRVLIGMIYW